MRAVSGSSETVGVGTGLGIAGAEIGSVVVETIGAEGFGSTAGSVQAAIINKITRNRLRRAKV